jgi:hypothetical protein
VNKPPVFLTSSRHPIEMFSIMLLPRITVIDEQRNSHRFFNCLMWLDADVAGSTIQNLELFLARQPLYQRFPSSSGNRVHFNVYLDCCLQPFHFFQLFQSNEDRQSTDWLLIRCLPSTHFSITTTTPRTPLNGLHNVCGGTMITSGFILALTC